MNQPLQRVSPSHRIRIESDRDLEEAALLMVALSFGPLSKNQLTRALKQMRLAMPDGSVITVQKLGVVLRKLARKGDLLGRAPEPPECTEQVRQRCLDQARQSGRFDAFVQALRTAVPALVQPGTWEYKWGRQRFESEHLARREISLALEMDDQPELEHLEQMCHEDTRIESYGAVLAPICFEPVRAEYLARLPGRQLLNLLGYTLHSKTLSLDLNHAVFAYVQAQISAGNDSVLNAPSLGVFINHLAERHILAGEFERARTLLDGFGQENTFLMRGMLALLTGRLSEASEAYDQAVKRVGISKRAKAEYTSSFPALLHLLLLVQSDAVNDRRRAGAWLKSGEAAYGRPYQRALMALSELLDYYEGQTLSFSYRALSPEERTLPDACLVMCLCLQCYYGAVVPASTKRRRALLADFEHYLRLLRESGARWLAMQCARLLEKIKIASPELAGQTRSFFAESGAVDLCDLWPRKEMWENQIEALEHLLQEGPHAGETPVNNAVRLAWRLYCHGQDDLDIGLTPVEQKLTKKGTWTKGRKIALQRLVNHGLEGLDYLTEQDRAVLPCIKFQQTYRYYDPSYELQPAEALRALVGHPHVFWEGAPETPVEIIPTEPEVHVVPKGGKLLISMTPYPEADSHVQILRESPNRVRVVTFAAMHRKLARVMGPTGIAVPKAEEESVLKSLQGLSQHIGLQSDIALSGTGAQSVEPDCQPRLRLQRYGRGLQAELVVIPLGPGSQREFIPGHGNEHLIESQAGRLIQTRRDKARERALAQEVLGPIEALDGAQDQDYHWIFDDPGAALELMEQLQALPEDALQVEWPKGNPISVRCLSASQFQLSIRSAGEWFEVTGTIQVDADLVIQMRTLLEQVEQSEGRYIAIGENQYLALSRQLRQQLHLLSSAGGFRGKSNTLQLHPLAAVGLDAWRQELGQFKADAGFKSHVERLQRIASYQPDLPSTLQAELRPYQKEGFVWLARLAEWGVGACLADDMGLGKTVEALAIILHRTDQGPTLVVAPTSVCANWVRETRRFAPTLRPIQLGIGDAGRRREIIEAAGPFDLIICSYTMLQQEAEALQATAFTTIVLDEAQAIKNSATKRSSAAMGLQGGFRLTCTGTPIENRISELWNLFRFINPGLLGSQQRFAQRFIRPIEGEGDSQARSTLKSLIQPFVLRRLKSQVLKDLPPRTETTRLVELTPEERALHESLRLRALERLEGLSDTPPGQSHIHVLAELMKLRRCCCNPRLVVPDCGLTGSKLEAFAELVDELRENNHKALVFSQFVGHLTLLREYLDQQCIPYQYLDGKTPVKARQMSIDAFQGGAGDLFLISLRAGGTGLNLTAADYVIHMDPWWNPAVEDQASDRAHRIGQTRPVTIYRLVAANTIEEKIVELHHQKRDLADSLLEGTESTRTLNAKELIALLREV
ncbi:MAG: DEAD/DEAH box helicase [Planctomycetes bacterium]|nr:DEAD/DEAH box helicase [Planctomycetota bacterium]